ncbi:UNKNOWN [Stylonychia lemnae]|uniref:Uncharacterized protein n=1 Tax=Stylonychia lemnae TaxID=5949 RepID=A0A078B3F3_STYLE|nr:UNKNOWN [Stylonychia lemnae]|eukprot:CDW88974.1 UNKNOWN [Stylonychia lemnae]
MKEKIQKFNEQLRSEREYKKYLQRQISANIKYSDVSKQIIKTTKKKQSRNLSQKSLLSGFKDHVSSSSSSQSDKETGPNIPYHYQYNKDDSDYLKQKKYQVRLRDLYELLGNNQACILPDPQLQCKDGIPLFNIFMEDFKERKQYNNFRMNFKLRDTKKDTCQLIGDIIRPQINKIKAKNPNFQQSESINQHKSKITQFKMKLKEELQNDIQQIKAIDFSKDKYLQNFLDQKQIEEVDNGNLILQHNIKLRKESGNGGGVTNQLQTFHLTEKQIQRQSSNRKNQLSHDSSDQAKIKIQANDDRNLGPSDRQHSPVNNVNQKLIKNNKNNSIQYDVEKLFQTVSDFSTFGQNKSASQERQADVREKWMANKVKLEKKILSMNKNQETIKYILDMIKDRSKPEPDFKYQLIKEKYEKQKLVPLKQQISMKSSFKPQNTLKIDIAYKDLDKKAFYSDIKPKVRRTFTKYY